MEREPCPFRIVEDAGSGFMMGAVFGGCFHAFKGARNSPTGQRFRGAIMNSKTRAPVLAGGFAVWGLVFSSYDCSFEAIRRKEDPWNSIFAGAATGGTLAIRAGPRAIASQALIGGVLLAAIEGISIVVNDYFNKEADANLNAMGEQDESKLAPPSF